MRASLPAIAALAACSPFDSVKGPNDPGAQSTIVAWYFADRPVHAYASEGSSYAVAVPNEGETVAVLMLEHPLADYLLSEGEIEATPEGRALPPFRAAYLRTEGDDFREITMLPAELAAFRFADVDPLACVSQPERCLVREGDAIGCGPCGEEPVIDAPALPVPPASPESPIFGGCPEGWISDPATRCAALRLDPMCDPDRARFFGSSGCELVTAACPAPPERFGAAPSGAFYIDPSAPPGGDGTHDNPLRSLDELLPVAAAGTVAMLAIGTHPLSSVVVPDGVQLIGACADTILDVDTFETSGADVQVFDLTLRAGTLFADDPRFHLRNVILESDRIQLEDLALFEHTVLRGSMRLDSTIGFEGSALVADGACFDMNVAGRFTAAGVVVSAPPCRDEPQIWVQPGATLDLAQTQLSGPIEADQATLVSIADASLAIAAQSPNLPAIALLQTSAVLKDVEVRASPSAAVFADRSTLRIDGAYLSENLSGILMADSTVAVVRASIAADEVALYSARSRLEANDVELTGAYAVRVDGGSATVIRSRVMTASVGFDLEAGYLMVEDAQIEDTAIGVLGLPQYMLLLNRIAMRATDTGIWFGRRRDPCEPAMSFAGSIDLEDIAIEGARQGILVDGARAQASRVLLVDADDGAFFCGTTETKVADFGAKAVGHDPLALDADTPAEVGRARFESSGSPRIVSTADVVISDVDLIESSEVMLSSPDASLSANLSRFRSIGSIGASLSAAGVQLRATSVEIEGAVSADGMPGVGISVVGGDFDLRQFRVAACADAGVVVAQPVTASLIDGVIEGNPIGLEVEASSLPELDRTRFRQNAEAIRFRSTR